MNKDKTFYSKLHFCKISQQVQVMIDWIPGSQMPRDCRVAGIAEWSECVPASSTKEKLRGLEKFDPSPK